MTAPILAFAREPDADVVAFLEALTEQARSGEITGFCAVSRLSDGATRYTTAGVTDRMAMIGVVTHMAFKLQSDGEG